MCGNVGEIKKNSSEFFRYINCCCFLVSTSGHISQTHLAMQLHTYWTHAVNLRERIYAELTSMVTVGYIAILILTIAITAVKVYICTFKFCKVNAATEPDTVLVHFSPQFPHRLNGSSNPVLTATHRPYRSYGKGQKFDLHKIKTLKWIKNNFWRSWLCARNLPQIKFGDDRFRGGASGRIRETYNLCDLLFFQNTPVGQTVQPILTQNGLIDRCAMCL